MSAEKSFTILMLRMKLFSRIFKLQATVLQYSSSNKSKLQTLILYRKKQLF